MGTEYREINVSIKFKGGFCPVTFFLSNLTLLCLKI